MVVKQRSGWGYETPVREVSDSLHLRRFCLISLTERVPDESTVRKLVRRLGPDVVAELSRLVIAKAQREQRFRARAMRCDSTVVEADVRYPSDAALAVDATRAGVVGIDGEAACPENNAAVSIEDGDGRVLLSKTVSETGPKRFSVPLSEPPTEVTLGQVSLDTDANDKCNGEANVAWGAVEFVLE